MLDSLNMYYFGLFEYLNDTHLFALIIYLASSIKSDRKDFCTFRFNMENSQKSIDIQHQVRNNATELNDFLRGMKSWQQEMQAKDQQLLDAKRLKKEKQLEKEPSTRKLVSPPPKRASKKVDDSSKSKTSQSKNVINPKDNSNNSERIKAYDYSAWDKFDVDKACNDVDKIDPQQEYNESKTECNNLEKNSLPKNATNEHLSTEEDKTNQLLISKQQAAAEKDRGNEYFKVLKSYLSRAWFNLI